MDDLEGILYGTLPEEVDPTAVKAQMKVTTVVSEKNKGEWVEKKNDETILESKTFSKSPSYLSIKYSSTISLGDYRMCRVEKGLFLPVGIEVDPDIQSKIQATNDWGCSLLEKLMEKEVSEAMAEKNKATKPEGFSVE